METSGLLASTVSPWTDAVYDSDRSPGPSPSPDVLEFVPITNNTPQTKRNVNDAAFNAEIRIIVLYVEIILGTIGGAAVCVWLWYNRRRKSRVNLLILHVTLSDFLVLFGACLPQLIWEYDRHWYAGNAACKIFKLFQSFCMMSSNYMLVVLGVDRHQAVRAPLREPFPVWAMTLVGYVSAFLLSVPQLFVYHINFVTTPGPFQNMTVCENIWRGNIVGRRAYLTYIGIVVVYIPLFIIVTCYVRIFLKIAQKANEGRNRKQSMKPGKVVLQSTPSSSLPKAKVKTLKMTFVIVAMFIICSMPYQALEMVYSYGDHTSMPGTVAAVLGGMAVANSATNPYVFLLFNANWKCVRRVTRMRRNQYDSQYNSRTEYGDLSRTASTYAGDAVELNPRTKSTLRYSLVANSANYAGSDTKCNR